jgi:hypothetical protein
MTNSRLHGSIALGCVLIVGAFVAFLPPIPPVSAQGHAQRICREEGISQASELHEICLAQTIRALEREDYWLARSFAHVAASAHLVCALDSSQRRTASAPALTTSPTRAV